ncbi:hypothetical protein [Paenibacillus sp. MBLB4367]|uniref:hypothetical protein n=1 Tax=Paenibacillus sp. MBLB4367 TaxID=3384767 RepID=UPI003907EC86
MSRPSRAFKWWLISMVIVSMLFYLLFEKFDPIPLGERGERLSESKNPLARLLAWWRGQRRYMQGVMIRGRKISCADCRTHHLVVCFFVLGRIRRHRGWLQKIYKLAISPIQVQGITKEAV